MALSLFFKPQQRSAIAEHKDPAFTMRLLTEERDRREAFALRSSAYKALGHLDAGADDELHDRFDELPTSAVFGAYDGDRLVGTLRVSFSHPWQSTASLPCAVYYPALQSVKREARASLVEISRLAVDPAISNTSYRTTLYATLVRTGYLAAQAARVSTILVATKPDWVRFYEYMLGFKMVGAPAKYPPGDFEIALLGGSLETAQTRQRAQNRFFQIAPTEVASMRNVLAMQLRRPGNTGDAAVAAR